MSAAKFTPPGQCIAAAGHALLCKHGVISLASTPATVRWELSHASACVTNCEARGLSGPARRPSQPQLSAFIVATSLALTRSIGTTFYLSCPGWFTLHNRTGALVFVWNALGCVY
jgi:hypothetical protein